MTIMLKPYPAMKDSGVEWLGPVPAHWSVMRTKWVLSRNDSGVWGNDFDDNGVIVLRSTEQTINGEWNIRAPAKRRLKDSEYLFSRLEEGDLLVTTSSGSSLHIGKTTIVTEDVASLDCCFSNFMQRLRVKDNMLPRFLWYCLNGAVGRTQLDYLSDTTTGLANLNGKIIGTATFAFPTQSEQASIVRFLDHADQRIQHYIRAKEKLIALLEEQKQAIIHQAVTGRIDVRTGRPYPAYKPSGVKWLGDVPAHWAARRLKTVCRIRYGLGQPPPEAPNGLPLIRATNVDRGKITKKDLLYVDASGVPASREAILREGEIIIVRSGAYTADSAIVPRAYAGAVTGYDLVADVVGALSEFVAAALLSSYLRDDQLVVESTRSAQPHLNAEELGSAVLLLPPRLEQSRIVDHLDQANAANDSKIADANRQIALLREYRTRLIADVVTGKLDVRSAAAQLPESMPDMDEDRVDAVQADDDNEPAEVVR